MVHTCPKCSKQFSNLPELIAHMKQGQCFGQSTNKKENK